MTIAQAVVYGLVQGLGEFLPISSSAHLAILPWWMGWEDPGLAFDVALHLGTLIALLVFFRKELIALTFAGLRTLRHRSLGPGHEGRMAWMVALGSIPGAVMGLLLEHHAEHAFRAPRLIAAAMAVMGVLLYVVDRRASQRRRLEELTFRDALLIGLAQGAAIIPGVSRSGATITAGRASCLDRTAAARFSFLLAIPITAGAALVKVPKLLQAGGLNATLVVGVLTAGVSGYLALDVLLRWVRTRSYLPFVIYRVAFAVAVLWLALGDRAAP